MILEHVRATGAEEFYSSSAVDTAGYGYERKKSYSVVRCRIRFVPYRQIVQPWSEQAALYRFPLWRRIRIDRQWGLASVWIGPWVVADSEPS